MKTIPNLKGDDSNHASDPRHSSTFQATQRRPTPTESHPKPRTDRNVARGAPWGAPGRRASFPPDVETSWEPRGNLKGDDSKWIERLITI